MSMNHHERCHSDPYIWSCWSSLIILISYHFGAMHSYICIVLYCFVTATLCFGVIISFSIWLCLDRGNPQVGVETDGHERSHLVPPQEPSSGLIIFFFTGFSFALFASFDLPPTMLICASWRHLFIDPQKYRLGKQNKKDTGLEASRGGTCFCKY